jgi:hypothetical protein
MALFDPASAVANQIRASLAQKLKMRVTTFMQVYNAIYNTKGVSPADIWTALATDGGTLYAMAQQERQTLNAAQANAVPSGPPAGWTETLNADGTVTATYTAPAA